VHRGRSNPEILPDDQQAHFDKANLALPLSTAVSSRVIFTMYALSMKRTVLSLELIYNRGEFIMTI
jgi:hypothetical protein